jgi:BMFP domain-containing protein YqiC
MNQPRFLNDLNAKVSELLAASPAKDLEKNMRVMMTSFFSRLDLVTRDEFDVQAKVLARTREKLETLEARLAEMERQASGAK